MENFNKTKAKLSFLGQFFLSGVLAVLMGPGDLVADTVIKKKRKMVKVEVEATSALAKGDRILFIKDNGKKRGMGIVRKVRQEKGYAWIRLKRGRAKKGDQVILKSNYRRGLASRKMMRNSSSKQVVRAHTDLVSNFVGEYNASLDFNFNWPVTVGLSAAIISTELDSLPTTGFRVGVQSDYWFNGAFQSGFVIGAGLGYTKLEFDLSAEAGFEDLIDPIVPASGPYVEGTVGYNLAWKMLNFDLRAGGEFYKGTLEAQKTTGAVSQSLNVFGPILRISVGLSF